MYPLIASSTTATRQVPTTVIHATRPRFIATIFAEMAVGAARTTASPGTTAAAAVAERLLARLLSDSTEIRAAAALAPSGAQLASTDGRDWAGEAEVLWRTADAFPEAGDDADPASQIHVGTDAGELFAIRRETGSVLATTERFALASLVACDLRAVLRGLEREA